MIRRTGDHPRPRGVYPVCGRPVLAGPGSSPPARGLLHVTCPVYRGGGIIPARAGFTVVFVGDDAR